MNRPSPIRVTGWRRLRRRCCWSRHWSPSSTGTATGTVLGAAPMTRWPCAAAGAGRQDWVLDLDRPGRFRPPVRVLAGGRSPHRRAVGLVVHLPVAESAGSRCRAAERRYASDWTLPVDDARWDRHRAGRKELHRVPRSRRCWLTCSCHYAVRRDGRTPGCPSAGYADTSARPLAAGPVPVPEPGTVFTVRLPGRLAAAVRDHARASGRTISARDLEGWRHPAKTKIVFCKDANRQGDFEHTSFDFTSATTFRGPPGQGEEEGISPALPRRSAARPRRRKASRSRDWHLNRRSSRLRSRRSGSSSLRRSIGATLVRPTLEARGTCPPRLPGRGARLLSVRLDQQVRHEALLLRMEVKDRPSPCCRSSRVKLEAA